MEIGYVYCLLIGVIILTIASVLNQFNGPKKVIYILLGVGGVFVAIFALKFFYGLILGMFLKKSNQIN
jgi:hypothetical protein